MKAEDLHPDVRKVIARTPRLPFAHRFLLPISRLVYNVAAATKLPDGITASIETMNGVDVLVFEPGARTSNGAILWMFGGGHWAGKPSHLNAIAGFAARELEVPIYVPSYRLAPRHPFPSNVEDCHAVWTHLIENAERLKINPKRIALAGNSAGGGLAAALAQKIRDEGGTQPIAQCLLYPMLDDRTAADRSLDQINHFVWNNKANYEAWRAYLSPHKPGAEIIPDYAAAGRCLDLAGLPPTWIGTCDLDLFSAENIDYSERLTTAGVDCQVYRVGGVPHAFEVLAPEAQIAIDFQRSAIEFLRSVLGG
ncbi:MAG: alpha/beta hydrolase fold domain-containing protein [Pseudomonadota bacterium]